MSTRRNYSAVLILKLLLRGLGVQSRIVILMESRDEVLTLLATIFLRHEATTVPFQLCWICHQVVATLRDPCSFDMIETAHRLLLEQTDLISDPATRRMYLGNVPGIRRLWHHLIGEIE